MMFATTRTVLAQKLIIKNNSCLSIDYKIGAHDCNNTSCATLVSNTSTIAPGNSVTFNTLLDVNLNSCTPNPGNGPGWQGPTCADIGCGTWEWDNVIVIVGGFWLLRMANPGIGCFLGGASDITSVSGSCGHGSATFSMVWSATLGGYQVDIY